MDGLSAISSFHARKFPDIVAGSFSTMEPLPLLPPRQKQWILAGLFALIGLIVYGSALQNGFVRWDDGLLIYENAAVRTFSLRSLYWIFTNYDPELYIPLTFLSYQLDYLIGGTDPFVYHLHSLILHTLNALLVTWLFFLLFKHRVIALIAGLLFLVHPLHTEAFAWASGRKDVLSALWFLLSIICYLYAHDRASRRLFIASALFFALSLMSKVMTATLPLILLLLDVRMGRTKDQSMLIDKIPYIGLSIFFGIIALFGKTQVIATTSLLEKILMAFKSAAFYIEKLFVPTDLSVLYPFIGDITIASPAFYIPVLAIVALLVVAIVLRRIIPDVLYGLIFFFITVAPTFINFAKGDLDLYFASDRYAYVPSVGILMGVMGVTVWMMDRRRDVPTGRLYGYGIGVVAAIPIVVLAWMAHAQSLVWKNTETLFTNVLNHYPSSYVAHANLGNAYRRDDDLESAIKEFEAALAIKPHARTYSNLGAVYRKQGNYSLAQEQYDKALAIDGNSKEAYLGLGLLRDETGQLDEAQAAYERAITIDPSYEEAYVNLGVLQDRRGQYEQAYQTLQKAIAINALLPDALYNLAVIATRLQQYDEAIEAYERTIDLSPMAIAARINLGLLYAQQGERERSIAQFRTILRIDPDNRAARSALEQLRDL